MTGTTIMGPEEVVLQDQAEALDQAEASDQAVSDLELVATNEQDQATGPSKNRRRTSAVSKSRMKELN